MIRYNQEHCIECNKHIDNRVYNYSTENFGHPMCIPCQNWFKDMVEHSSATNESIDLYFALKRRDVPAILEKNDGFKTIDIAVPHAKVNIEVDGAHHNYSSEQAMRDLHRTLYSFKKGYSTLRIPNSLARHNLEEAADLITEFLITNRDRNKRF